MGDAPAELGCETVKVEAGAEGVLEPVEMESEAGAGCAALAGAEGTETVVVTVALDFWVVGCATVCNVPTAGDVVSPTVD